MERRRHRMGDLHIPIHIISEKRRSARVAFGTKAILLRIPINITEAQRHQHFDWAVNWLEKLYVNRPKIFERYRPVHYENGSKIKTAYKEYELFIDERDRKTIKTVVSGNSILLTVARTVSDQMIGNHISRALAKDQLYWIEGKVRSLNQKHFGETIRKVSLRHANTRWGSCNSNGNISISTRCLLAPEPIIDHIIIHELAHLKEMNHSEKFWGWVKKALPDYKLKERWLKKNGHQFRF